MFIAILGRQPDISLAELEAVYGVAQVRQVSAQVATVATDSIDLSILGGTTKIGEVITTLPLKQLRDGGFPDHIVTQRIAALVSRPWMRDLSGDAQDAVKAVLSSPSLSEHLAALNAAIGKGGSR